MVSTVTMSFEDGVWVPIFSPQQFVRLMAGLTPEETDEIAAYTHVEDAQQDLIQFLARTVEWFRRRGAYPDSAVKIHGNQVVWGTPSMSASGRVS